MPPHQPHLPLRRKLLAAARRAPTLFARNGRPLPAALFLTDPQRTPHPEMIAQNLPRGWAVIFRHFGVADRFETGSRLARACRQRGVLLLIAADPDLARRLNADGVHWPEADLGNVRPKNPRWIETASAHSRAGLTRAKAAGVDAAILSAVFPSRSPSAGRPIGALVFRQLVAGHFAGGSPLPIYPLGGVTAANAGQVFALSGRRAAGVAAIDAIREAWS